MKKLNSYLKYLWLVVPPLILVFIWFRKNLMIAMGESAIPFYNLQNTINSYSHTWSAEGFGFFPGNPIASLPFFWIAILIQKITVSDVLTQAVVFFLIAFGTIISSYFCYKSFLPDKKFGFHLFVIAALFYCFNFIALFSVWNRMQYPFMVFYILLPVALAVFAKGLTSLKMRYVIIFNLAILPFSTAFILPFIELLWALAFLYVLFRSVLDRKNKKKVIFYIAFFIVSLAIWIFFNAWWLLQYINFLYSFPIGVYTSTGNIDTFNALSTAQGNLSYIFRLINRLSLMNMEPVWGMHYSNFLMVIITYIPPFLAFLPLLFKRKPAIIYFFLGLCLFTIFFTKGSAPPFGEIFHFLFSNVRILEVFRGPFEKIGLLLPLSFSILIGYSLYVVGNDLRKRFSRKISNVVVYGSSFLMLTILVFPMWNSWVFSFNEPPQNNLNNGDYVKVPDYYQKVDELVSSDPDEFRGLALPLAEEGITYTWDYGYGGVEYTNGLLSDSFFALAPQRFPFVVNIAKQIPGVIKNNPQEFSKMLSVLNTKYVIVRTDIDYRYRGIADPSNQRKILTQIAADPDSGIIYRGSFGKIDVFENKKFIPKIYASNKLHIAPQELFYSDLFSLTDFTLGDVVVDPPAEKKSIQNIKNKGTIVVSPQSTFNFASQVNGDYDDAVRLLPVPNHLPGSRFYALLLLKEKFDMNFAKDEEKLFRYQILISKRLSEIQIVTSQGEKNFKSSVDRLNELILEYESYIDRNPMKVSQNRNYFQQNMNNNLVIANELIKRNRDERLIDAKEKIFTIMRKHSAASLNTSKLGTESKNIIAYTYTVENAGEYSILLKNDNYQKYYTPFPSNMVIQIDNQLVNVTPSASASWIDFGKITLSSGVHEILIAYPDNLNILTGNSEGLDFNLITDRKSPAIKKFPLDIDYLGDYKLSFENWIKYGEGFRVSIHTDIDRIENNQIRPRWEKGVGLITYENYFNKTELEYEPFINESTFELNFHASPYNTCPQTISQLRLESIGCDPSTDFYSNFNKETNIELRNVKLERKFDNLLVLRRQNNAIQKSPNPAKIEFKKVNNAKYIVTVEEATEPFVLVFSEAYDNNWQAKHRDTKEMIGQSDHYVVNGYANSWLINRGGNFEIELLHKPENVLNAGIAISIISVLISVIILIYLQIFKK